MKFIHMSDTHLVKNREGHYASDPIYKLQKAVESINKHQNDADFVVITGDLTDDGDIGAYKDLKEILDQLVIPYKLIIGNHDSRENYFNIFGDKFDYQDSFAHFSLMQYDSVFLFLDTKYGDWHDGGFCEERFAWLREKLEQNSKMSTYLFMHHPPFEVFHKQMDDIGFKTKDKFWDIVSEYENVKHVFFGHVHFLINGSYRGVGYSSVRSTNHQVALLSQHRDLYFHSSEQPTYSIVHVKGNQVNYIPHEYLNEEMIYPGLIPMEK